MSFVCLFVWSCVGATVGLDSSASVRSSLPVCEDYYIWFEKTNYSILENHILGQVCVCVYFFMYVCVFPLHKHTHPPVYGIWTRKVITGRFWLAGTKLISFFFSGRVVVFVFFLNVYFVLWVF